jgi:DNA invertase Pin-like site-specific DNA recombinase
MARAYSYVRFSSAEQRRGDSLRRQLKAAQDYCALHRLDLDTELTLHDLGVSGFHGDNLAGALGAFLAAVSAGHVEPGSTLIVESVDRLSRQDAWSALPTLQAIIGAGITLVTLSPERAINTEALVTNPFLLMEILLYMIRANEESATKSRRARLTWEGRRAKAAAGVPQHFGKLPSWIRLNRGRFQVDSARAKIIRDIADAVLQGRGQLAIARDLNRRGVPPLGRGTQWHKGNVYALLRQPSLVGTLLPREYKRMAGKRPARPAFEPVENYYPAILDQDTWSAVQEVINRPAAQRGQHVGRPLTNIFAGLLRCRACGSGIQIRSDRRNRYLQCGSRRQGKCEDRASANYVRAEYSFLLEGPGLIREAPRGQELDGEIRRLQGESLGLAEEIERAAEAVLNNPGSRTLAARLRKVEAEGAAVDKALQGVLDRAERAQSRLVRSRLKALNDAVKSDPLDRAAVNAALRQSVDRIILESDRLRLHWRHGGMSDCLIWPVERTA